MDCFFFFPLIFKVMWVQKGMETMATTGGVSYDDDQVRPGPDLSWSPRLLQAFQHVYQHKRQQNIERKDFGKELTSLLAVRQYSALFVS